MKGTIKEYIEIRGGTEELMEDEKQALKKILSEGIGRSENDYAIGVYDFFKELKIVPRDPRAKQLAKGGKGSYEDGVEAASNDVFLEPKFKKHIIKKLLG